MRHVLEFHVLADVVFVHTGMCTLFIQLCIQLFFGYKLPGTTERIAVQGSGYVFVSGVRVSRHVPCGHDYSDEKRRARYVLCVV